MPRDPPAAMLAPMATADGIRIYALDGGRVHATGTDASELSDDGAYEGRTFDMAVPCFLIRHPHGDLMWDTGMSPTRTDLGDWATPGAGLVDQLEALDVAPADIRFLAVSHGHWDHSGNAGLFVGSTWIVNPVERAIMFDDENRASPAMDDYGSLETADTRLVTDDHDVFGDGSVVIVQAPGHTPGHVVLLARPAETDPILLSGDLWHLAESRRHRRMPIYNTDRAQTLASMDRVEALAASTGARVVIQHEFTMDADRPRVSDKGRAGMNSLVRDHLRRRTSRNTSGSGTSSWNVLTDDDLAFRPGPDTFSLGELCREIGDIEHSYVQALRVFRQDFEWRNPDPQAERSVAVLTAWYSDLDRDLLARDRSADRGRHRRPEDQARGLRRRRLLATRGSGARHLPRGPVDLLREGQHLPARDGPTSSRHTGWPGSADPTGGRSEGTASPAGVGRPSCGTIRLRARGSFRAARQIDHPSHSRFTPWPRRPAPGRALARRPDSRGSVRQSAAATSCSHDAAPRRRTSRRP